MNKFQVIESIVMPGGWHKPEKDRLGRDLPQPIRADTYKKLVEAVVKFRVDNVIPVENAKQEIDEYICTNFPHMCHSVIGAEVEVSVDHHPSSYKTLTDQMIQWLDTQVEHHSAESLELKQEAMRRAEICLKCPYNVKWNSGCGSCSEAVSRLSTILRIGNDVPKGYKLKACQILKHENRSAVWLRPDKISKSLDLPQHCWAK